MRTVQICTYMYRGLRKLYTKKRPINEHLYTNWYITNKRTPVHLLETTCTFIGMCQKKLYINWYLTVH